MNSWHIPATVVAVIAAGAPPAWSADVEDVNMAVPYSATLPTTVGTGLDFDLINQARFTCAPVKETDLIWLDTQGSIETKATIELVTDYTSLAKTLNLEVDYKSKADVSIAALKGGASVDMNIKYDTFAKDESRTLALVVKAQSDYGRKGLRNRPPLDAKYQALIDSGDFAKFRELCGTHTVTAEHHTAMIATVITLSDVSASARQSLQTMFKTGANFGGTISAATVSGSVDMTTTWKQLIETGNQLGKMHIDFESKGGLGIPDATKLAITNDPRKLDVILAQLATVGTSFTKENSGIAEYVVASNSGYGLRTELVNPEKLDRLNSYYLALSKVDFALKRIDDYKTSLPSMYTMVYVPVVGKLKLQRSNLVTLVEKCVLKDDCPYVAAARLDVLYVEDIVQPDTFEMNCYYKRFDSNSGNIKTNVLNTAALVLTGKARLTNYVSVPTAIVSRLGDTGVGSGSPIFQSFSMAVPDAMGTARFKAQLDTIYFNPTANITDNAVTVTNLNDIVAARKRALGSIYGLEIQARNGQTVMNSVGPAYGGDCPVQMPAF